MGNVKAVTSALRGKQAEDLACAFLQKHGLKLLQRNFRSRRGEIDLVMEQAGTIVFVEVRYRARNRFGTPAETVDYRKRQRLLATAAAYLQGRGTPAPSRFDVVAISGGGNGKAAGAGPEVHWIENAFGE